MKDPFRHLTEEIEKNIADSGAGEYFSFRFLGWREATVAKRFGNDINKYETWLLEQRRNERPAGIVSLHGPSGVHGTHVGANIFLKVDPEAVTKAEARAYLENIGLVVKNTPFIENGKSLRLRFLGWTDAALEHKYGGNVSWYGDEMSNGLVPPEFPTRTESISAPSDETGATPIGSEISINYHLSSIDEDTIRAWVPELPLLLTEVENEVPEGKRDAVEQSAKLEPARRASNFWRDLPLLLIGIPFFIYLIARILWSILSAIAKAKWWGRRK